MTHLIVKKRLLRKEFEYIISDALQIVWEKFKMLKKIIVNLFLIISLTTVALPQTSETDKKEKEEKLKEDTVIFLRETSSEISNLRTAENRIGFSSEIASLMWFYDEKEARAMFNNVTTDFRQMLQQLDAQLNATKFDEENSEMYSVPFLGGANRQAQLYRKFSKVMSVRQQIATALSEHDALLAYSFFTDTGAAITNPQFKQQNEQMTSYFETQLLQKIAEQNAAKGLEFGRKSLAKGVKPNHIDLLKKIYEKDPEAGASFGEEIISKLKSDDDIESWDKRYLYSQILSLGLENRKAIKEKPAQKPIFSEQSLRDISELAAQEFLSIDSGNGMPDNTLIEKIEQITPARAAQIRQKTRAVSTNANVTYSNSNSAVTATVRPPKPNPEKETFETLATLDTKKLSDEDRAKAIAEAGKMIEKIQDPNAKMMALSGLAVQIKKTGDKDLALEIMKQAESFVNQTPKSYVDYMQMWMLASSYSQIEPDKSFPILESAVLNLNDTISAFIKVAEFIDASGEIMEDGEVQVSGFGGGGIMRELGGAMMMSGSTLKSLAEADFARTRNLTNRFDRTEVRILAKMLVLRAMLGDKVKTEAKVGMIEN